MQHKNTENGADEFIERPFYPMAMLVYFQFTFAAITITLLAGSVLTHDYGLRREILKSNDLFFREKFR
jgi:ammonia channel protein AmtB